MEHSAHTIQNPFLSGVMGLAIGDALGAPAEFGERWMRDMDPVKEMRGGGIFEVPAGGWTDDAAMTLATLESLKHGFDQKDMMNRFVSWLRHGDYTWSGEAIGVGMQILRAIEAYEATSDVETCGQREEMDNGNGSLMRILPVCLFGWQQQRRGQPQQEILAMVARASALTHRHERSIIACTLYYFLVCALLEESGPLRERLQIGITRGLSHLRGSSPAPEELAHYSRLFDIQAFAETDRSLIRSSGYVVDTLEAAVWCLITTDNYRDCLLAAVNLGLDTDTIAAIAGGLAGLYYGYAAIPAEWLACIRERERIEAICRGFDASIC